MVQGAFRFEDFELDPARFQLTRAGQPVRVEPRAFDLLRLLVSHHERVVTKQEILEHVWGTEFVSDAALTTALRTVRRAVGDTGADQRVIRTAHGRGYQLVAEVQVVGGGDDAPVIPSHAAPAPAGEVPGDDAPAADDPGAVDDEAAGQDDEGVVPIAQEAGGQVAGAGDVDQVAGATGGVLASTGASHGWPALAGALALILAGGVLLASRSRIVGRRSRP
ncbi:winged helix-turn-helix domain-containing protein [Demequina gelatinilytica]|uniref:winged helix-turn-helix domain-containing protein n=1 Tax=Demequina gelatinilytica TaxID=1638980 RepID=UPI001E65A903|nr:transcriptional regulator [Demequina gelatinilytica]